MSKKKNKVTIEINKSSKKKKMKLKEKKKASKKAIKSIMKNRALLELFARAFMMPDVKKKKIKKILKIVIKSVKANRHAKFEEDPSGFIEEAARKKESDLEKRQQKLLDQDN